MRAATLGQYVILMTDSNPRGQGTNPRYTICITHYNDAQTVERSLQSILDQIDNTFEVVLVDQRSTDGSLQILQQYESKGSIRLYHQETRNRGLGRKLAFEMSKGETIVGQVDMDDFFLPNLKELLTLFQRSYGDKVLRVKRSPVDGHDVLLRRDRRQERAP